MFPGFVFVISQLLERGNFCFLAVAHFLTLESKYTSYYFIHTRLLVPNMMAFRQNIIVFPYHFILTYMHASTPLNYKMSLCFLLLFSKTAPKITLIYNPLKNMVSYNQQYVSDPSHCCFYIFCPPIHHERSQN